MYRHKRTHSREDGGDGSYNMSAEEEEELSGEDQLGSLEETSPTSDMGSYVPSSLNSTVNSAAASAADSAADSAAPPHSGHSQATAFNSLQTLSMPMTISQPATINGMM